MTNRKSGAASETRILQQLAASKNKIETNRTFSSLTYQNTDHNMKAVAVLRGDSPVTGTVSFTQNSEAEHTTVEISLKGLTPGKHGFHIQYVAIISHFVGFCQLSIVDHDFLLIPA